jgi:hypothetical protein
MAGLSAVAGLYEASAKAGRECKVVVSLRDGILIFSHEKKKKLATKTRRHEKIS